MMKNGILTFLFAFFPGAGQHNAQRDAQRDDRAVPVNAPAEQLQRRPRDSNQALSLPILPSL